MIWRHFIGVLEAACGLWWWRPLAWLLHTILAAIARACTLEISSVSRLPLCINSCIAVHTNFAGTRIASTRSVPGNRTDSEPALDPSAGTSPFAHLYPVARAAMSAGYPVESDNLSGKIRVDSNTCSKLSARRRPCKRITIYLFHSFQLCSESLSLFSSHREREREGCEFTFWKKENGGREVNRVTRDRPSGRGKTI